MNQAALNQFMYEYKIYCGSLAGYYHSYPEQFLNSHANQYLQADASMVEKYRSQLREERGISVGISWRGGRLKYDQDKRSIALVNWREILQISNITHLCAVSEPNLSLAP
jgi:hypothetical protein